MKLNTGNEMPPQLGGKRPKFNIYWVWAAVAVVILSWGLLGSGEAGVDLTVGLLLFLCILVTVCTGLILSKLDALKKQLGQRDPVGDASDQGQELAREE